MSCDYRIDNLLGQAREYKHVTCLAQGTTVGAAARDNFNKQQSIDFLNFMQTSSDALKKQVHMIGCTKFLRPMLWHSLCSTCTMLHSNKLAITMTSSLPRIEYDVKIFRLPYSPESRMENITRYMTSVITH